MHDELHCEYSKSPMHQDNGKMVGLNFNIIIISKYCKLTAYAD